LIWGTVLIGIITVVFVFTSLGSMSWEIFGKSSAPLIDLSMIYYGTIGKQIFTLLVYLAIIGSVAGWIVSAPRLVLAMARDRLFLSQFAKIHPKYHTPHYAIIFQTILTSIIVFAGAGSYNTLLLLLVPIVLVMYSAVILSVIVLRYKQPKVKRHYRVPFGKVGPIIVVLILLALLGIWAVMEAEAIRLIVLAISFIALGIPIYILLELYYNPKTIRKTNNLFAYLVLWTERIALPLGIRKQIIKLLGNIKGKTILEFGCSVGTLTMHLAEEVGKNGKVYATDISEKDIEIAKSRLLKKGHTHVTVIHDVQHHHRVHPDVPTIHTAVSVGMIGYVKNVKRVLQHMNKRLKKGAKICFLDYDKFFDIIPNKEWLGSDEKIKKIFNSGGFDVKVVRKQGFAWRYIFIYGKKVKNVK